MFGEALRQISVAEFVSTEVTSKVGAGGFSGGRCAHKRGCRGAFLSRPSETNLRPTATKDQNLCNCSKIADNIGKRDHIIFLFSIFISK